MVDLPKKPLWRVDEVAEHFDVTRQTIYLWIDHGQLEAEKYKGVIRIPRDSIINFRLASRVRPLE
jgi:excisionase family DNA binding protein